MSDKPITILSRIEILENKIKLLEAHLDSLATSTKQSFGGIMQTLQGVILASGEGFDTKVEQVMTAKQKERVDAKAAQEKAQADALIEQGILVPVETVEEGVLLVGRVLDANGNVSVPRLQTEYVSLTPEAKKELSGKSVGYLWESSPGNKFELLEIYEIVLDKKVEPELAE